jgi:uncharacterized protein (DUF983 family)
MGPDGPVGRALRYLGRALRRRCPNCGGGGLWVNWLRMRAECPSCGLHLERGEQGYIVGAYMFNIVAAELVFAAVFVAVLLLTWPSPPWTLLQVGAAVLMVAMPFLFYPYSKTLFLAFDLYFRPRGYEVVEPGPKNQ